MARIKLVFDDSNGKSVVVTTEGDSIDENGPAPIMVKAVIDLLREMNDLAKRYEDNENYTADILNSLKDVLEQKEEKKEENNGGSKKKYWN